VSARTGRWGGPSSGILEAGPIRARAARTDRVPARSSANRNLHALWDVCVVEKALGTGPKIAARDLLESITQTDKAAWVVVPVEGWANEFFQITRRKFVQYCIRIGTKCVYQQGNETYSEGDEEKVVVVNLAYLEQHAPPVPLT